jgi:hypothetical protein
LRLERAMKERSGIRKNKSTEVADDSLLVAGIQKHLAGASVILNGTTYTGAELVKALQSRIDAVNTTLATQATWRAAVKAESTQLLQSLSLVNALRKAIYTMFSDIAMLADFGLTPHKTPELTPAERIAATAKAKATRAARHTMGSQQKKAVKGTVTPPVTTSSTPVTPATPAGSAGSPAPTTAPSAAPVAGVGKA